MTNSDSHNEDSLDSEERLAAILEEVASRAGKGESVDVELCLKQHPEFAERLRELLPTITALTGLDRHQHEMDTFFASESKTRQLGDFRLIREIGRGGMGIVYEAEQLSLGRRVALKVLPFAAVLDERQLQRFRNEARAVAGLHHPNILPVYSVGSERGVHYYAMQQVNGQSVAEVITALSTARSMAETDRSALSPQAETIHNAEDTRFDTASVDWFRRIAAIARQVADALEYAHGLAIIHRDIKPANLLLDESGKVWVADFGLAQVDSEAELTMTGELIGTLRYMSPEQLQGDMRNVDFRTDIFSLGATVYELLTLRPLRVGTSRRELVSSNVEDAPAPRAINPAVPIDLETIVLKAISREPENRYRNVGDLADDLGRFLDRKPILARRPTINDRLKSWSRRNQDALLIATAVLAVIATVSTVSAIMVGKARDHASEALRETREKSVALAFQKSIAENERRNAQASLSRLLAQRGIDAANNGNVKGVFDLVDACAGVSNIPEKFRPLSRLWGIALQPHIGRLVLADSDADVVAFDPSSRYVALARNTEVWVCSLVTGQRIGARCRVDRPVGCLKFSPDGRRLVAHSVEGSGQLFTCPEMTRVGGPLRHEIVPVEFPAMMKSSAAFHPNGSMLITVGVCGSVKFWDTADGTLLGQPFRPGGVVTEVDFHPNGKWFVTGGTTARVWDVETRESVSPLLDHFEGVNGGFASFSADGTSVATLKGLWDVDNWRKQDHLEVDTSVARGFSRDSRLMACARRDWSVLLWHIHEQKPIGGMLRHPARVRALDFSPDGSLIACAAMDETVHVWNVANQSPVFPQFALPGPVSRVHFSSDGRYLAACSLWGPTRVWRTSIPVPATSVPVEFPVECMSFLPERKRLAVADAEGTVHIYTTAIHSAAAVDGKPDNTLKSIGVIPTKRLKVSNASVAALAWSPDGRTLACATTGNQIQLWDTGTWSATTVEIGSPRSLITSLSFHPSGKTLAIGACDWIARILDVESASVVQTVRCREQIHAIQFHQNGRFIVTGLQDGTLRIWDSETGERVGSMRKHQAPVRSLSADPDFLVSVSGDRSDGQIRFWSMDDDAYESGLKLDFDAPVRSVSFLPETESLAILDWRGNIRIWQLPDSLSDIRKLQQVTAETLGAWRNRDGTLSCVDPTAAFDP